MPLPAASSSCSPALSRDAHERLDPRLRALYRTATPAAKLAIVGRLNAASIALKRAQFDARSPALSPVEKDAALRRWWFSARD